MGRKSYLGGSSVIHVGNGWFRHKRTANPPQRPVDPYIASVKTLQAEQEQYASDLSALDRQQRQERLLASIEDAVENCRELPAISFTTLIELCLFEGKRQAYRLRFPKETRSNPFSARRLRLDARHVRAHPLLLYKLVCPGPNKAEPVFVLDGAQISNVLGCYPSFEALREEAANSGWLVTAHDLATASDAELRNVWEKRERFEKHAMWSVRL